ncbi:hypothetical protein [Arcobacter vandammei]|uniref:hypothetical protein n=1 Tax=Arcobacter vandammei TaxID=2782243 RepID=UPI0018E03A83|nr:hypothetical protein [Arcobacter vandammei]
MSYRFASGWNNITELQVYKIFRILFEKDFPRGLQSKFCKELSKETKTLSTGSISAKICNYKSIAGINRHSNASNNSKMIYEKYKNYSIIELDNEINKLIQGSMND